MIIGFCGPMMTYDYFIYISSDAIIKLDDIYDIEERTSVFLLTRRELLISTMVKSVALNVNVSTSTLLSVQLAVMHKPGRTIKIAMP